ncbi:MAG TPA: FkbM family methyltransferase [Vicinamibacterales bacterium]|jgi:FkbM family methyltransferase
MLTVLDIGVRGGPDPRWYPFAQMVDVVGVEADADECARLARLTFPVQFRPIAAALGACDGEHATLYLTRHRGCSSVLQPNRAFLAQFPYGEEFTIERTVPLTLTTLDSLCDRERISPDVIKIDTQGSELHVLRGGRDALSHAFLVEMEVEFNPLYLGQPLFGDVDRFLRDEGFMLLGIRRSAWRRTFEGSAGGTVVHGDALYYREEIAPADRSRFALALRAYGQDDFVRTLGEEPLPQRRTLAQRVFGTLAAKFHPHRWHRAWIDQSRPSGAEDWHDPFFFTFLLFSGISSALGV